MSVAIILTMLFLQNVAGGTVDDSLKFLKDGDTADVIIEFPSVLTEVLNLPAIVSSVLQGDLKRNLIINLLQLHTSTSQFAIVNALKTLRKFENCEQFWVANRISLKGATTTIIHALSQVPGNFKIRQAKTYKIFNITSDFENINSKADAPQPGVAKIGADRVQKRGINGRGKIVCIIDSGVNAEHIALKSNYKNDAASWKDAYNQYTTPYDGNGHGTHCAGIAVGTTNGIGVAPGAQWIACRGLDDTGSGDESALISCGQWAACPAKNGPNCYGFPDVVSNSWGGGQGDTFFTEVVNTWQALEIVPVMAIGNDGPNCNTAISPGDQSNLISVGATDINDKIADFSSRGPAKGTGLIKPEICAPGVDILSADYENVNGYVRHSGTSMATPNVAGAIALLLQANPNLNFQTITTILYNTAEKLGLVLNGLATCSNDANLAIFPNNVYGNGRINIAAAVEVLGHSGGISIGIGVGIGLKDDN